MRRRPGVVPYEGPDEEHRRQLKIKLGEARFIVKYLANGIDDSDIRVFTMVVDSVTGEKHIFYNKKEHV